ncbi:foldase protein PrsA [Benzoatithermus flavus]|uniref:Parvulin-like PPIase n=1 Tax=Benzoatithermus flavus TaxID=3108223 RepID=A0ABU8XYM8_9PROT
MRRFALATTALAVLVLAGSARAETTDPVLAVVNGAQIRKSDLEAAYQQLPEQYRQMPLEQIYEPLLDRVIDGRLLLAEAEKENLAKDPKVQEDIQRARDNVLRDSLVQRVIDQGTTKEKVQAAYEAMKSQPGFAYEEVHAEHILVGNEADARDVLKQLANGADFATVAKEKSTDPSAKSNGGDLGYFRREAMVPEFADAAFSIPPGTVGKDPVKTQFGWHVIKVDDRRQTVPTLEEKEPEIREQLARQLVDELLANVRKGAKIERFNLDGTPKAE